MLSKREREGIPVPTSGEDTAPLQAEGVKHTKAEITGGRREREDLKKNQGPQFRKIREKERDRVSPSTPCS